MESYITSYGVVYEFKKYVLCNILCKKMTPTTTTNVLLTTKNHTKCHCLKHRNTHLWLVLQPSLYKLESTLWRVDVIRRHLKCLFQAIWHVLSLFAHVNSHQREYFLPSSSGKLKRFWTSVKLLENYLLSSLCLWFNTGCWCAEDYYCTPEKWIQTHHHYLSNY